jgi:DHA1 family bicyclomycin/chloramphenicol resistance-like MFS transporter
MLRKDSAVTTGIIAALVALGPLSTDMYLPGLPSMALQLDAGADDIQLTLSVFLVGFAISQLFYGALSDRFGRKPVLLGSLALFIVATFGCSTADTVESLIAWRFVQSIGACAGPVLGRAMVRDIHGRSGAARVLSHIGTVMALAPAVAPLAGGYLVVAFGWQSVFVVLCLYGVAILAITALSVPESIPQKDPGAIRPLTMMENFLRLLGHRAYLSYTLSCAFVFSGLFAFLSGSSFVIINHYGIAEEKFGYFFALIVAGYVSGTTAGGKLSRRFGTDPLIFAGSVISCAAGLTMLLLIPLQFDTVFAVVAPMMAYMVGVGIVMPQTMAGALAPFPMMAGAASALLGFIQMSMAAAIGVAVGQFHDGTPLSMVGAIALMGTATLVTYGFIAANRRRPAVD